MIGSRQELKEFAQHCAENTEVYLALRIPKLRLWLPSKHFYEVLYNRLANDLPLWSPSSPFYHQKSAYENMLGSTNCSVHVAGLYKSAMQSMVGENFTLCKSQRPYGKKSVQQ